MLPSTSLIVFHARARKSEDRAWRTKPTLHIFSSNSMALKNHQQTRFCSELEIGGPRALYTAQIALKPLHQIADLIPKQSRLALVLHLASTPQICHEADVVAFLCGVYAPPCTQRRVRLVLLS